jgi:hypothetical protein
MNHSRITLLAAVLAVVLMLAGAAASTAVAQEGVTSSAPDATYSIPWYTIDGGGGLSGSETYTLQGTAGQPDAGAMIGGGYTLTGGYWYTRAAHGIWMPLLIK